MMSNFNKLYNKIITESNLIDQIDSKTQYQEENKHTEYAIADCETQEIIKGPSEDLDELKEVLYKSEDDGTWPENKYGIMQRFVNSDEDGNVEYSDWEPVEDID